MWRINKINIVNLGSYKNQEIIVQQNKTFLVLGKNYDDEGQDSNGSGKSWVIEALSIGLIGQGLKKIPILNLIRDGEKFMNITLELENKFLKKTMLINRIIKRKGSPDIVVEVNGIDQSDKIANVGEADKFILSQIGISKEDLLDYYLISKKRYRSFFSSSDTSKKEVISRFSGADLLSGIDEKVSIEINQLEDKLGERENNKIVLETRIDVFNENILKEQAIDPEEEKNAIIEGLLTQAEEAVETIGEKELAITERTEAIIELKKNLDVKEKEFEGIIVPNINQILDELGKKIQQKRDAASEKNQKIRIKANEEVRDIDDLIDTENKTIKETKESKLEYEIFLSEIEAQIKGLIECPSCNFEFSLTDKDFSAEKAKETLPELKKSIETYTKVIEQTQKNISTLENNKDLVVSNSNKEVLIVNNEFQEATRVNREKIEEERENAKEKNSEKSTLEIIVNGLKRSVRAIEERVKTLKNEIIDLEKRIPQIEEQIKDEQKKQVKTREEEYLKEIKKAEGELTKVNKSIAEQATLIFEEKQWLFNFKKFNSYLANQAIGTIEGLTNSTLRESKTNLQIQMEGFRLLKSGDLREKITTEVFKSGVNYGILNKLSEGEISRIELANIVSLQELINNSTETGGLDFLAIDEILASLDAKGVELSAKMLSGLGKTVYLISHVGVDTVNFENLLKIEKRNSISKII